MKSLLIVAGVGQLALAVGSLWIPALLGWRDETKRLEPITRAVFWTYAAYIWGAHVAFAIMSLALPDVLLDGSALSRSVAGFIAIWWGVRLALQVPFHRLVPEGRGHRLGEAALTIVFAGCAIFYGAIALGVET